MKLTQRKVDSLAAGERETVVWDAELPGFGVRVKPSGHRSYVIQYRRRGVRSRRMTIGDCAVYKLEQARARARRLLVEAKDGGDPAAARDADRFAPTIKGLADRYLVQHAEQHKKASSVATDRRNLANHVLPLLGAMSVKDVTRADIDRFLWKVTTGKTAREEKLARTRRRVRGGPGIANRCAALLGKMFNLAERWGLRQDGSNPVRHVTKNKERRLRRYLSPAELGQLGKALASAEHAATERPAIIAAIRLLVFTGARLSEILTARWEYFDADRACLRLPDSKTGAKEIHLNAPALEVLNDLQATSASPWIIPGSDPTRPLVNLQKPWRRFREAANLNDVRIHDLRHSFASAGIAGGLTLPMIGALLGHSQPATTARYAHLAADPMRHASDVIGKRIAAAMRTGAPGKDDTVAPLKAV